MNKLTYGLGREKTQNKLTKAKRKKKIDGENERGKRDMKGK